MKEYCCLCGIRLKDDKQRYIDSGNFCPWCSSQCSQLANLYPGELYSNPTLQQIEHYQLRKEFYELESNRFQLKLKEKLLINKQFYV